MTPRVSLVMPAYNAAETIGAALESVLSQSEPGWELIVVNDGSTDDTAALVRRAADNHPGVHIHCHPDQANLGRGASRNLGVRASHAPLVAFLDADDLLLPEAVATYLELAESFPTAGVFYGQVETFGSGVDPVRVGRGHPLEPMWMLRQLARFNVLANSATAARRQLLGDMPFPRRIPGTRNGPEPPIEDWACWVSLARTTPFVFVRKVLARYRVHPGGGTVQSLAGDEYGYWTAHARCLRAALDPNSPEERRALREGLQDRATECLRLAMSRYRRGRFGTASRMMWAGVQIAGSPWILAKALARVRAEHLRAIRGTDPPLTLVPALPEPEGPTGRH